MTRRNSALAAILATTLGCAAPTGDWGEPVGTEPILEVSQASAPQGNVQVLRAELRGDIVDLDGVDGEAFLTNVSRNSIDSTWLYVQMYVPHARGVAMVSLAIDE